MKFIRLFLLVILYLSSSHSFSLQDGYLKALENDIDTQINKNNLKTIEYDKDIADSMYLPKVDLSASVEVDQSSQNKLNKSDQYGAKISQPLFDGFEAKFEKKLQDSRYESAKYYLEQSKNNLAMDYIQSYINTLRQKDLLDLGVKNLAISEDIFNKVYKKVSVGYGTKLEFEIAKENYIKAKVDLSTKKINYRNAIESLRFYVHMDFDTNELIKPTFYFNLPKNLQDSLNIAMNQNPSYLLAKTNVQVAIMEQKRDLKSNYPSLALVGSYSKYNSLNNATNDPYDDYKLGLEFNYNLYNGGKKRALSKKAIQKINEKTYLLQKTQYQLESDLRLSWNNYSLNKEKEEKQIIYKKAKKDVLDATIKEFDLGLKDLNSLMDEHNSYILAKSDYINTSYDFMLAKYKVLASIGTLSSLISDPNLTLEKKFSNELFKKNKSKKNKPIKKQIYNNPLSKLINIPKSKQSKSIEKQTNLNTNFKDKFLNSPSNKYTINLAYTNTKKYAQKLLDKYKINNNSFYFSFGKIKKLQKIMMGIYDSRHEAKIALNSLPKSLKKAQPRIELISIKQKLYHKYHGNTSLCKKDVKIIKQQTNHNKISVSTDETFKKLFLSSPSNKYTINLAYTNTKKYAQKLLDKYKINNNSFYFSFGKIKKLQKIMMGIYDSRHEAKIALNSLPKSLKKAQPRIELISIKQKLYHKYHSKDNLIAYLGSF